jgi:purine-binding chemotaxis protein CheW
MNQSTIEESQYLTFQSGIEVFGIGILRIKEIKEYVSVTTIPMMPDYIKGVINLRGNNKSNPRKRS